MKHGVSSLSKLASPGPPPTLQGGGQGGGRRDGSTKGYTDRARLRKGTELERLTASPSVSACFSGSGRQLTWRDRGADRGHVLGQRIEPRAHFYAYLADVLDQDSQERRLARKRGLDQGHVAFQGREIIAVVASLLKDMARHGLSSVLRRQPPHRRRGTAAGGRGLGTTRARSAISNARAIPGWA